MHTIAQREFTLEDFSHEHLGVSIPAEKNDGEKCYQNLWLETMKKVIEDLNIARNYYIREQDAEIKNKYWWQMIQLLPSSYNQTRNITLSYEAATNIYRQRKHHKLDEWREFCSFLETLPYPEFIIGKDCITTVLRGDNMQTVVAQSADEIRIGTIPANKIKASTRRFYHKKGDTIC